MGGLARDVKTENIIQCVDVMTGAITSVILESYYVLIYGYDRLY